MNYLSLLIWLKLKVDHVLIHKKISSKSHALLNDYCHFLIHWSKSMILILFSRGPKSVHFSNKYDAHIIFIYAQKNFSRYCFGSNANCVDLINHLGAIGNVLNLLIFTRPTLSRSSCTLYLIAASIDNILVI